MVPTFLCSLSLSLSLSLHLLYHGVFQAVFGNITSLNMGTIVIPTHTNSLPDTVNHQKVATLGLNLSKFLTSNTVI